MSEQTTTAETDGPGMSLEIHAPEKIKPEFLGASPYVLITIGDDDTLKVEGGGGLPTNQEGVGIIGGLLSYIGSAIADSGQVAEEQESGLVTPAQTPSGLFLP